MKNKNDNYRVMRSLTAASKVFAMLGVSAKDAGINLRSFLGIMNKSFEKENPDK